ncbi:MAG TPA: hypothetical protein VGD81_04555, partial [Opitutaceae bacterium]
MKLHIKAVFALSLLAFGGAARLAAEDSGKADAAALTFAKEEYFHRWSKDDQHEFTPRGQEDLMRWSDMVTLHSYQNAKDGEGLAATANAVLENYKRAQAKLVRTDSVPRTAEKPAEYLIVVLFPQPDFIEAVFARFKLEGGVGRSFIYSHREYGKKVGDQMSAWLQKNGPATEKALMSMEPLPVP